MRSSCLAASSVSITTSSHEVLAMGPRISPSEPDAGNGLLPLQLLASGPLCIASEDSDLAGGVAAQLRKEEDVRAQHDKA